MSAEAGLFRRSRRAGVPIAAPARVGINALVKRVSDVVLALLGLLVAAPLMLLISAILALESPKEIVFAQRRVGRGGRPFLLYKFRKFPVSWGDNGPGVTVANDARMTRFGTLLERTKLDELPQLWNILKGDMSFVGPRPESFRFAHLFSGEYRALLDYLPGVFGPAQIAFRNESELYPLDENPESFYERELFPRKGRLDLDYYPGSHVFSDGLWIARGLWVSAVGSVPWRRIAKSDGKLILIDLAAVALSWTLANLLRFLGLPSGTDFDVFLLGLAIFPITVVASLLAARCYRYPQRYFSYSDALRLVAVALVAWLLAFFLLLGLSRPASLYLIPNGGFILPTVLLFPRVWIRLRAGQRPARPARRARLLIYGPGDGGVALANWVKSGSLALHLVGFLDDDPTTRGRFVHGTQIVGSERDLPTLLTLHQLDEIWITFIPVGLKRERLQSFCHKNDIRLVIIPETEPFARYVYGDGKPGVEAHV